MRKKIRIVAVTPDGIKVEYPSIKEAAAANRTSTSMIYRAVNFGYKVHGMLWEEAEIDG